MKIYLSSLLLCASIGLQAQNYTIPIGTARLLIRDAFQNRVKDSLLQAKDSIILHQQAVNLIDAKSYQQEIALLNQNLVSQKAISEAWRENSVAMDKKLVKAERRKKFWITAAVILGGVVGVLTVSQ